MEYFGRKRKGAENIASKVVRSHVSLGDYSRRRKRCKELVAGQVEKVNNQKGFITGIVTAPPFVSVCSDPRGRGLKRKIGCLDSATKMGRKKKIEQDFEPGQTIGKGKFGSVVKCQNKVSGEEFACKILTKGEEIVHKEVEIMQHLSGHPGVVALKAVYEDAQSFHLVMELCSGGRLLDQMRKDGLFSEQKAANLIKELMLVLKYCHDMGVVHRDVKPENILLSASGLIKLADFGLAARLANGQSLYGLVGSPAYVAPEVLTGGYSEKVDIWSAGVVLHALLVGLLPFGGDSVNTVFEAVKNVSLNFQDEKIWGSISEPARDLIARMLTRNVSERYTAEEVLRHPWILFYTNQSLGSLTFSSKKETRSTSTSRKLIDMIEMESERNIFSFKENSTLMFPYHVPKDDCCMVDVLALAISRVRISEPKRSRICSPTHIPAQQEHSSNITIKSLCRAC